jgi:hypothetical protein
MFKYKMLYKIIYEIINEYMYNIQIIDEERFKYRCSQCRKFFLHTDLKECLDQRGSPCRIYCYECIDFFKWVFHNYKEFK